MCMSERPNNPARHVLVVTGRGRERLYERFVALFAGRSDVEVVKDRRLDQRRRVALCPRDGERRVRDRRQAPPNWVVPPA